MMDHVDQLTIEIDDGSRTLEKDCDANVIPATAQPGCCPGMQSGSLSARIRSIKSSDLWSR